MLLILTQNPSYSFSCLFPSLRVFCRNEENKKKIKQFRQELKELCKKEAMVATIDQNRRKTVQSNFSMVTTMEHCLQLFAVWL